MPFEPDDASQDSLGATSPSEVDSREEEAGDAAESPALVQSRNLLQATAQLGQEEGAHPLLGYEVLVVCLLAAVHTEIMLRFRLSTALQPCFCCLGQSSKMSRCMYV